ncbi:MAG: triose-phosphate isomerase family protein [Patescibacteria group bacterium]
MKNYLIANWKQNKTSSQILSWFEEFSLLYQSAVNQIVVICPSYPYLPLVKSLIESFNLTNVFVGSQDISVFEEGSHTGEVSVLQLKDFGTFSIIGHSERSEPLYQTQEKVEVCLRHGINPILCLKTYENFQQNWPEKAVLVWEDPKAISKEGVYSETPLDEIIETSKKIKALVGDRVVVYGGSANPDNVSALYDRAHFNGFLVGKASLEAKTFNALLKSVK